MSISFEVERLPQNQSFTHIFGLIKLYFETQPFFVRLSSLWLIRFVGIVSFNRETRTLGKMNQTSGTQAFPYQQPVGQVPPGQFQPVFVQAQASPGQYVQQPVGQVGQPQVQPVQPAAAPAVPKTTAYWQSALIAERVVEFVSSCSSVHKWFSQ